VHALDLTWGPVKGDILIDRQKGVLMLEMAARLSGDYFCYETIPLHNGINLLEVVMDLAMGVPVEPARLQPTLERGVALRYVWPTPGEVVAIEGVEEARRMPGVQFVRFEPHWRGIAPGHVIRPARSMGERVASVMAVGTNRTEAIARAEAAVAKINIRTKPVLILP
jgi:biotin carboxylase